MSVWPKLARDFARLREIKGWGAARTLFEVLVVEAGFQALVGYRCAHTLRNWGIPGLPALLRRLTLAWCGVDLLPSATIGGGCYIPHCVGIVIGGASEVGEDCTILQGVTLGEARFSEDVCPTVGNRVTLGAGAKVLGGIRIGDDSVVAANAVVLDDVPAESIAIGAPAKSRPARDDVLRA